MNDIMVSNHIKQMETFNKNNFIYILKEFLLTLHRQVFSASAMGVIIGKANINPNFG